MPSTAGDQCKLPGKPTFNKTNSIRVEAFSSPLCYRRSVKSATMSVQVQGTIPTQREELYKSLTPENAQVKNYAGGYVFKVDDMMRLQRFVIIGCENGTYYAMQEKLERKNVECLERLIQNGRGVEAVQQIKDISVNRRNVKQNSLLFAYAICARSNDKDTKKAAYAVLSDICRIPTHLFMFIKFCEKESIEGGSTGWGRAHKRAISSWYLNFEEDPEKLVRFITKYKSRESWSHKDVVRLAHTHTSRSSELGFILRFIAKDLEAAKQYYMNGASSDSSKNLITLLEGLEEASLCTNVDRLCAIIKEYKLTWEQCPSDMLRMKEVWLALLPQMPIEALIRNLGRMSNLGMFSENSEDEELVLKKIGLVNNLKVDRVEVENDAEENDAQPLGPSEGQTTRRTNVIHPFKILVAWATYKKGHGDKGSLKWTPNQKIVDALDNAFYQAFEAVVPTNKKYFLAVDVSGSMSQPVLGNSSIDCSMAAAAMMMMTLKTEKDTVVKGFSHQLKEIDAKPDDKLEIVMRKVNRISMGGTDCSLPMKHAMEQRMRDIDVFVVYTDNETWYGNIHPSEALKQYRQFAGRPQEEAAKLIVCGMCATEFSIADPEDHGMLDVVGFDSAAPRVISDFVMGKI